MSRHEIIRQVIHTVFAYLYKINGTSLIHFKLESGFISTD